MAAEITPGRYRARGDPHLIQGYYEVLGTAVDAEHISRTVVYKHESSDQWYTASRPYFAAHWQRIRKAKGATIG